MKNVLLGHGEHYIEYELDGLRFTYKCDDDAYYYTGELKNEDSFSEMKKELLNIYHEMDYESVLDQMNTVDFVDKYFKDEHLTCYCDLRTRDEIHEYEKEACDKVWYMRSRPVSNPNNNPKLDEIELGRRKGIARVLNTYKDIPEDGYTDWECGYWNGIMGALRWVLGDEKDFLDT